MAPMFGKVLLILFLDSKDTIFSTGYLRSKLCMVNAMQKH